MKNNITNEDYLKSRQLNPDEVMFTDSRYDNYIALKVFELMPGVLRPKGDHSFCIHRAKNTEFTKNKWLYDKYSQHTMAYCGEVVVGSGFPNHVVISEGLIDSYTMKEYFSQEPYLSLLPKGRYIFISSTGGVGAIFTKKNTEFWKTITNQASTITICLDNDIPGVTALAKGVQYIADLATRSAAKISWGHVNVYKDANECRMALDMLLIKTLFVTEKHTYRELLEISGQIVRNSNLSETDKVLIETVNKLRVSLPTKRSFTPNITQKFGTITDLLPTLQKNKLIVCPNPKHADGTPSAGLIPRDKCNNADLLHCFGCGYTGDFVSVYALIHGMTRNEAYKLLQNK